MKINDIIVAGNVKYRYLGNGCKATGADKGWKMSKYIYFRCTNCGYMMNGDMSVSANCDCRKLSKDSDWGRFGSALGDDAIEVYCKV